MTTLRERTAEDIADRGPWSDEECRRCREIIGGAPIMRRRTIRLPDNITEAQTSWERRNGPAER